MPPANPNGRPRPIEYLYATLGYAAAACVLLYPIFTRGGGEIYSPPIPVEGPIARWVMWILSWHAHALTSAAQLFDANSFYPAPNTLVFGDPLLGLIPFFSPVYLLTGNPVISYQFTLLATFAMCGASMYYLARHWGAGFAAAAVAGLVYALCPARITMMAQLAYLAAQFLPLALLFADRLTQRARITDAALLFFFASWQVLSGTQLAYASLTVLAVYLLTTAIARGANRSWRGFALALAAVVATVGVFVVSTAPYRALADADMITGRTMRDFALYGSAGWRAYLVAPPLAQLLPISGGGLYLGIAALTLALIGAADALRRRHRSLLPLLVIGATCCIMSLGPEIFGIAQTPYRAALDLVPGFEALGPAPSRFALFLMIPIAALAAFGTERLVSLAAGRRVAAAAIALVVGALVLADYRLPFQRFEVQRVLHRADEMPVYAALAQLPPGPVLELPVTPCSVAEASAAMQRQLASTLHWKPLLDGYQSHDRAPATYSVVRAMANALPDPHVLQTLRRATGMRYLVVHLTDLAGDWRHRWRSLEGMTRLGFFGHDLLFEVDGDGGGELLDELLALPRRERTLTGVDTRQLDESQRAATLRFTALPQQTVVAGNTIRAEVMVENRSRTVWPALTTARERKVHLSYLWTDAGGKLTGGDGQAQPLPLDLGPGESVVVPVCVEVPRVTGDLKLAFGLTQADEWFADLSEQIHLKVIP